MKIIRTIKRFNDANEPIAPIVEVYKGRNVTFNMGHNLAGNTRISVSFYNTETKGNYSFLLDMHETVAIKAR